MAPHQQPRWTARGEGLTWGGLGGAPLRNQVDRLRRSQPQGSRAADGRGFVGAQTPMTDIGSGTLAATDYITEPGRWLVTAHATVGLISSPAAAGRLEAVITDIGVYPAGPSPRHDVVLGGGAPATAYETVSFIASGVSGDPILIGGRYYPASGDVDEAWLVWRAFRLA